MGCTQGPACSSSCQVFAFLGFLASAMWINAAATELVNILRTLGVIFQLSNTVLGLTLLAWGNSIGGEGSAGPQCPPGTLWGPPAIPKVSLCPSTDTFSDLTMARQGYPRMAFSACFGGIIFSILWVPGPGWWHVGQELPQFPCLQPRESLWCCGTPGEEGGRIHPRVPPTPANPTVFPQCKGSVRDLGSAGTEPAARPCPHGCPSPSWLGVWAAVWQIWELPKGRRGEGCASLRWVSGGPQTRLKPLLECSRLYSPQTENASAMRYRKEEDEGQRDVVSAVAPPSPPVLCVRPEHALDILVGVGLGCLLQMTSSQPLVKVRLW